MIKSFPGWTINDVLDTDDDTLMDLMEVKMADHTQKTGSRKTKKDKNIIPMHEFLKNMKGG